MAALQEHRGVLHLAARVVRPHLRPEVQERRDRHHAALTEPSEPDDDELDLAATVVGIGVDDGADRVSAPVADPEAQHVPSTHLLAPVFAVGAHGTPARADREWGRDPSLAAAQGALIGGPV